jgi:hypothetical protein
MQQTRTTRRKEYIVVVALALIFVAGIFGYFLLIGGGLFIGFLISVGLLVVLLAINFFLWGGSAIREKPKTLPTDQEITSGLEPDDRNPPLVSPGRGESSLTQRKI